MKKEQKNKVGRPRLADKKLKNESIIVSLIVLVLLVIIAVIGFNILTINYNPKYSVGTIYNTHVNSCVVENNQIKCGPNVTYMKYKLDDGEYEEFNKTNSSITVKLSNYKKINVCYKTDKIDLRCNK